MYEIKFYIGLEDKDTKTQLITSDDAIEIVHRLIGDSTIINARGTYNYNDGEVAYENSIIVLKIVDRVDKVLITETIRAFEKIFNQERVLAVATKGTLFVTSAESEAVDE